jgi:hypothetical protein
VSWYAVRRVGTRRYVRLRGQPEEGMASISDVIDWLLERGLIERREDSEGHYFKGWGTEHFAGNSDRDDPWEPEGERLGFERRAARAADEANERIRTCHERVACPRCGAPVGGRCFDVRDRGKHPAWRRALKHPHRERWTQEVPAR